MTPRRIARADSGPILAPQARQETPQPSAPQPGRERSDLAGFAGVAACDRFLLVRKSRSFTFFLPVCSAHRWVGQESLCDYDARAQICQHHVHAQIAASRAERAEREGFVRFDGE